MKQLSPDPCIIVTGCLELPDKIAVAADKQIVCCTAGRSILDAFLCLMAVCYVFLLDYPVAAKNVCVYLQKCILQIQDGKKLPTTLMSFVNNLDTLVSEILI